MKIGYPLIQFNNERALIVVSGARSAKFYFARKGVIAKADSFVVKRKVYSDKEGFFLKSGHGKTFGSGSVLKDLDEHMEMKFLKKILQKTQSITTDKKINSIYLFSPEYSMATVLKIFGKNIKDKIRLKITGDFVKMHPIVLVRKIQSAREKRVRKKVPRRKEAMKILTKPGAPLRMK